VLGVALADLKPKNYCGKHEAAMDLDVDIVCRVQSADRADCSRSVAERPGPLASRARSPGS
jgi:hypothetical protein